VAEDSKITAFRADFPEFGDVTAYPESMILFWYGIAEKRLIQTRWADLYTHGLELCTAHLVSLAKNEQNIAAAGGTPGSGMNGMVASESVGDVSASYNVESILEKDAGQWNATSYGRMFINLANIVGMGGAQL
jgi:hypothetical protein